MAQHDDSRWSELVGNADVIENGVLRGIQVTKVEGRSAVDDVIICNPEHAAARIRSIADIGRTASRTPRPDRVFLARALSQDAVTAAAMLTRACIARWTQDRGRQTVADVEERCALALAEAHLLRQGHRIGDEVLEARHHIAPSADRAPVGHADPADVIRKAVARVERQIGGRHVIVMTQG